MAYSNHQKPHTAVQSPPPPQRRTPFEPPSPPPAYIHIPISIGKIDESVCQAFPSPLRANGIDDHKKVRRKQCLLGRSATCREPLKSIDKVSHHDDKCNDASIIDAVSIDGTEVCSANFMEMLNKADTTIKDAENMLKLLEMAKHEMSSNMMNAEESDRQGVDSSEQEALVRELEDRHSFSRDVASMPLCNIQPHAFEALKMLYGQDSFYLTQGRASRPRKPYSHGSPDDTIEDAPPISAKQLTDLFATESSSMQGIDPGCFEECPKAKESSSSPRDLVVRNESRELLGYREVGPVTPRQARELKLLRSNSNSLAVRLDRLDERNKPPPCRHLAIRSKSCDIGYDSSELSDISPSSHHPRNIKSARNAKASSKQFKRACSEGVGNEHKLVPPPLTHLNKHSIPVPQSVVHTSKPNAKNDKCNDGDNTCLPGSYADIMSLARRMSSNRSLGEPSVLNSPNDEQYWKSLRGRSKSKKQMRGKGLSAKSIRTPCDTYDSCGGLSGAEISHIGQISRKNTTKKIVASRCRTIDREKSKQEGIQECNALNVRSQCLDRLYSRGRHQHSKRNGNQVSDPIVNKNKIENVRRLRKNKNPLANSLGRAGTGSTDNISGSLSTADSKSTRGMNQSWDGRKSFESGPSKKSTKSLLFSKRKIMDSGNILSAAADIFQHQCIQTKIDKPDVYNRESSCDSSLSCYSENTSD
ncbi:hypothetical protein ACHAWX_002626 [Stephanocyclus meneghinianus]